MNRSEISFEPVVTMRASEAVYEQIKGMILKGELKPGDRLPSERAMMDMIGRSRPTIREAMRMLEQNGFIKIVAGSNGAIVQEYGIDNIEQPLEVMLQIGNISPAELYEFRMQCECSIAEWAASRRSEEDVDRIQTIIRQSETLLNEGEYGRCLEMDDLFHQAVTDAACNRTATIISKVLHHITSALIRKAFESRGEELRQHMCTQIILGHKDICDAIEKQDASLARIAMANHLVKFKRSFE